MSKSVYLNTENYIKYGSILGCNCEDSSVITSSTCLTYKNLGFCSNNAVQEYCPKTCGICTKCNANLCATETPAIISTTNANTQCNDSISGCSQDLCNRKPGYYNLLCKKTYPFWLIQFCCNDSSGIGRHEFYVLGN